MLRTYCNSDPDGRTLTTRDPTWSAAIGDAERAASARCRNGPSCAAGLILARAGHRRPWARPPSPCSCSSSHACPSAPPPWASGAAALPPILRSVAPPPSPAKIQYPAERHASRLASTRPANASQDRRPNKDQLTVVTYNGEWLFLSTELRGDLPLTSPRLQQVPRLWLPLGRPLAGRGSFRRGRR